MTTRIIIADVFDGLAELADDSVHCIVTSPPYWGLRDYGVEGQIGLEPTIASHLSVMCAVFREVRRVLRKDGTVWINYGDSYASTPNGRSAADCKAAGKDDRTFRDKPLSTIGGVLKPKDLCMIPNRLAIALQEDGWWIRSEIIWAKPNPMPESITDRPATSHEKIWLLSKSAKYFYDAKAVRVPSNNPLAKPDANKSTLTGGAHNRHVQGSSIPERARRKDKQRGHSRRHAGFNDRWQYMTGEEQRANGRNLRNVWSIATGPFSDAHFATFPPALVEPCIKAGCPENGTVLDPFGGAGTVGLVADRLRRNAILIELNPEYAEIATRRIARDRMKRRVANAPDINNAALQATPLGF